MFGKFYVIAFTSNMFYAINAYVWKSDFLSYLNNDFMNQCVIGLKCVINYLCLYIHVEKFCAVKKATI